MLDKNKFSTEIPWGTSSSCSSDNIFYCICLLVFLQIEFIYVWVTGTVFNDVSLTHNTWR
jgi:hypothetical protein